MTLEQIAANVGIDAAKLRQALEQIREQVTPCGFVVLEEIGEPLPNVFSLRHTRRDANESARSTALPTRIEPCFILPECHADGGIENTGATLDKNRIEELAFAMMPTTPVGELMPFVEELLSIAREDGVQKCEAIALRHQQVEGTYAAGKKAGAFECAEALRVV